MSSNKTLKMLKNLGSMIESSSMLRNISQSLPHDVVPRRKISHLPRLTLAAPQEIKKKTTQLTPSSNFRCHLHAKKMSTNVKTGKEHKFLPFSDFLTDTHGRQHNYLRISITEKCNLRYAFKQKFNFHVAFN